MSCNPLLKSLQEGTPPADLSVTDLVDYWSCLPTNYQTLLIALMARSSAGSGSAVNVTPTYQSVTGAGSTTAGVMELSILNVGGAAGVVGGVAFPSGASTIVRGYVDETGVLRRIGSVTYDATGTTFLIQEIP